MSRVSVTVRLTRSQLAVIRRHAEANGVSAYQAAIRVMEAGLSALMSTAVSQPLEDPIGSALGELLARTERLERLADRALYAGCAAYAYGRQAALGGARDAKALDEALAQSAGEAYRRQRDLARGGS